MTPLIKHFESIHPLPPELVLHLYSIIKRKELPKKGLLVRAGQLLEHIYFIEQGLLRGYYKSGDSQISSWFAKSGDLCMPTELFLPQPYSQESIQALESTVIYYIRYHDFQQLYQKFPELYVHTRLILERCCLLGMQRIRAIVLQRAQERYAWLIESFPDLAQRVPGKYLASYIGITHAMFSRLRHNR